MQHSESVPRSTNRGRRRSTLRAMDSRTLAAVIGGGFNWWFQRFPVAEVVVVVVLKGRPETPRVVRERFWDLVRSGLAPGDAGGGGGQ